MLGRHIRLLLQDAGFYVSGNSNWLSARIYERSGEATISYCDDGRVWVSNPMLDYHCVPLVMADPDFDKKLVTAVVKERDAHQSMIEFLQDRENRKTGT